MSLMVCSGCSTRYASGLERCPHCGSGERVEEGAAATPTRLPSLDVACTNPECSVAGVRRRVMLRCPVPGVVEMPSSLRCAPCGYELWTSDQRGLMEEETMPKVTRHGGPTNAAADREQETADRLPATGGTVQAVPVVGEDDQAPAVLPEREHPGTGVPMEGVEVPADGTESPELVGDGSGEALPLVDDSPGEEESSAGNSSSTSAEKPPSSPEKKKTARPRRARTTASPSKADPTASSTADGTDGSGPATPDDGAGG